MKGMPLNPEPPTLKVSVSGNTFWHLTTWGFPRIRNTFSGVTIIRIIVLLGLYYIGMP